jgi:MoaA/NifB/PqqE/SkfB family radical SAM enzyme
MQFIMNQDKFLCAAPFVNTWVDSAGNFRNCCIANPPLYSTPGQTFANWWSSSELNEFRNSLQSTKLPPACNNCAIKESVQNESFRTAVNKSVDFKKTNFSWPMRWDIQFGNKCNLGCWTCNEDSSSLIMLHKKKAGILPTTFKDSDSEFYSSWENIKLNFFKSYEVHDTVTLIAVGGEPMFNKKFLLFLQELVDLNLSTRTKLEIHTNGTHYNSRIEKILSVTLWKYICVFVSVDAVGAKSNWLRYGSDWDTIEQNIEKIQNLVNYVEIHCVLSVLNVSDLVSLHEFCISKSLKLQITTLSNPEFMRLDKWPLDKNLLCDQESLQRSGFSKYYDLIGTNPDKKMQTNLQEYIKSFDSVRKPLKDFDKKLAKALGLI